MNMLQKKKLECLIVAKLLVSTGCTEPIAIAHAAAVARKTLNESPDSVELFLSGNMVKNAKDAGVPGSTHVGAAFVASMGVLFGDSSKGFELLENITKEQQEEAYEFSKTHVKIHIAKTDKPLYIEIIAKGKPYAATVSENSGRCLNEVRVVVADDHKKVKLIEYNGEVISSTTNDNQSSDFTGAADEDVKFSMKDIFEYASELEDFAIFEKAIKLNSKLSEEGKVKHWGLDVGKMNPFSENTISARIVSAATSAVDARMAGAPYPAMACTGSGNQGITVTMPIYQLAKELGETEEKTYRAEAIGVLTAIYIKKHLNVLSHLCGAVVASASAAAGMTYLLGGTFYQAEYAVQNVLASVSGMFCDGAKNTCALKVAACVSMAIYASNLAMTQTGCILEDVGFVRTSLEGTIKNLAHIESNSSNVMDSTILDIMTNS